MENLNTLKKLKKQYRETGKALFGNSPKDIQDINKELKQKHGFTYVETEDDFSHKTTCMYVDEHRKAVYSTKIDTQDYVEKKADILKFTVDVLENLNRKKQKSLLLGIW